MRERKPAWGTLGPKWWHHHGDKIRVVKKSIIGSNGDFILMETNATKLKIEKQKEIDSWTIEWKVRHGLGSSTSGIIYLHTEDIERAFDQRNNNKETSQWLIEEYGGTDASQGKFIRYRQYLNIPSPGTGHDGDPNISIELNDQIIESVKEIILKSGEL